MLSFTGALKVYVAREPTDMRKSFNALAALVSEHRKMTPTPEPCMPSATGGGIVWKSSTGMERAFGLRPTAGQHNARVGLSSKILYPFHPLFGVEHETFGAAGGKRDIVYVRLPDRSSKGVPMWMFDPAVCASVHLAEQALIDPDALLELARLLDSHWSAGLTGEHEQKPPEEQKNEERT